ncbi:MAG: hypothetical protein HUJ93_07785, partial [Bacteroidales bacterium]|nr:hypothetical protein [Bacteroidales bacterium]
GAKNIATNYLRSNFVRIDNISVAYNVPKALLQKISIQGLRVALSVRNPFLITAYPVGDPEGGDYTMQSFNLNLNITL